jgi:hypothetical protein
MPRGGQGMGTALPRQLVDVHGGRISAARDSPGHGAALTVWLRSARHEPSPSGRSDEENCSIAGLRIGWLRKRWKLPRLKALLEQEGTFKACHAGRRLDTGADD